MDGGITIRIPHLPVIELILVVIALLLFRILRSMQDVVRLLRTMQSDEISHQPRSEKRRSSPPSSRQNRYPNDVGPTRSEGTGQNDTGSEKHSTPDRSSWSSEQPARPLKVSAGHFAKCLVGAADVDVALFIAACENYCKVLTLIGPFTLLSIREVHSNMKKIEHSFELAPLRYRSMRELLDAENAAGMHQPGGLIVDPSAAMGLLWARRGLQFWIIVFRDLVAQHESRVSRSHPEVTGQSDNSSIGANKLDNLKDIVERGYAASLQPFFGWLSNNSMSLALRAVPAEFPMLAPTMGELLEDLQEWADVVGQLVERMVTMQLELDLEDKRKSI